MRKSVRPSPDAADARSVTRRMVTSDGRKRLVASRTIRGMTLADVPVARRDALAGGGVLPFLPVVPMLPARPVARVTVSVLVGTARWTKHANDPFSDSSAYSSERCEAGVR